jgi:hypothetical protein
MDNTVSCPLKVGNSALRGTRDSVDCRVDLMCAYAYERMFAYVSCVFVCVYLVFYVAICFRIYVLVAVTMQSLIRQAHQWL